MKKLNYKPLYFEIDEKGDIFLSDEKTDVVRFVDGKFYPLHLYIEVSGECNLNCEYCYWRRREKRFEYKGFLTPEKFVQFLEKFPKLLKITLTGGEPFLNPHIDELIKIAKSKAEKVFVNTNLTVFKYYPDVKYIVSFDTTDPETFQKMTGKEPSVLETIKKNLKMISEKTDVIVNIVISKNNSDIGKLIKTLEFLDKTNVKEVRLIGDNFLEIEKSIITEIVGRVKNKKWNFALSLRGLKKPTFCNAGIDAVLDVQGNLFFCPYSQNAVKLESFSFSIDEIKKELKDYPICMDKIIRMNFLDLEHYSRWLWVRKLIEKLGGKVHGEYKDVYSDLDMFLPENKINELKSYSEEFIKGKIGDGHTLFSLKINGVWVDVIPVEDIKNLPEISKGYRKPSESIVNAQIYVLKQAVYRNNYLQTMEALVSLLKMFGINLKREQNKTLEKLVKDVLEFKKGSVEELLKYLKW